ncbi:hypothetical protein OCUAc20_34420 [Acinetobacter baumannii]|nr:hypothetical protein OCUAc20_34420 [Acinetobacter baumannii]
MGVNGYGRKTILGANGYVQRTMPQYCSLKEVGCKTEQIENDNKHHKDVVDQKQLK